VRADMSHVIVERPRRGAGWDRRGRDLAPEDLPTHEGMRRSHVVSGRWKALNENLAPLRRFLERQVGRPWDLIYSEIAANLRADNTVQQHVRDHIDDFVAVKPRRGVRSGFLASRRDGMWHQPLFVDAKDGILKRTDRLPEERARARAEMPSKEPPDSISLAPDLEFRRIDGLWYEIRLAEMPPALYEPHVETRKVQLKPHVRGSRVVEIEVTVRRLVSPPVRDVVVGRSIPVGPAIDEPKAWVEYKRLRGDRCYAVGKRRLSHAEMRRHGIEDRPEDV